MKAVEQLTAEFWPGVPVIPIMSAGATDGSYLRNAGIPDSMVIPASPPISSMCVYTVKMSAY